MAGEVNKIKFTLNGKEITLKEGERLGSENRKLKDLGSLWTQIDTNNNKRLDKEEFSLVKKLASLLDKDGKWDSKDMQQLAAEFENSGQEVGDFLDLKLKNKEEVQNIINNFDLQKDLEVVQKAKDENAEALAKADAERRAKAAEEARLKAEAQAKADAEKAEQDRLAARDAKYSSTHVVSENETLGFIAKKLLQDSGIARPSRDQILELVDEIAEVNGIEDVNKIRVGQKIRVPADVSGVETLKPKAPPQPEEKVPTADEMMEQLTLPDRVADIKDLYNNAKTEKDFAALKDKIDAKLAPYVLDAIEFEPIQNPVELNNDRVKIAKNALMQDLVVKLLQRAKELDVVPGKNYTLEDIKTSDIQKELVMSIECAVRAEEAKTNYEIKPGKYVTKDEQGRVTRDLRVEVSDGGFYVYEQKYNAERGWVENHYDKYIGFDKPGVYTQYEPHGKTVKAEHTVVEENGRLKVITRTPIEGGHKTETWYVDDGRKNTPQINTLRAELRELNKKLGEVNEKLASEPERKYEHTYTKLALEKQIKAIEEKIASLQEK